MFLGFGREPEHLEETHTGEEGTCIHCTERPQSVGGFKPRIFIPSQSDSESANHCTTVASYVFSLFEDRLEVKENDVSCNAVWGSY